MLSEKRVEQAKRRATGGARKRCRRGKSCGATCIAAAKMCLVDIPWAMSPQVDRLARTITRQVERERTGNAVTPRRETTAQLPLPLSSPIRSAAPAPRSGRPGKEPSLPRKKRESVEDAREASAAFQRRMTERARKSKSAEELKFSPSSIRMVKRTKSRVQVEMGVLLRPAGGIAEVVFQVGGSTRRNDRMPRRDKIEAALIVRRMYNDLVAELREGTRIQVNAYTGDGGGQSRADAYSAMGFTRPRTPGDTQYSVKQADGSMKPSKVEPGSDYLTYSEKESVKLWYTALFGDDKEVKKDAK